MRRWLVLICVILCVGLLSGCKGGRSKPTAPVTTGFSCTATADYNGLALKGTLTRRIASTLTLTLDEPATLKGLTLRWEEDALTAELHGITATLDPSQLPQAGAIPLLLRTLDAAATLTDGGERTADGLTFRGETDFGSYTLVSDPETGNLLTLDIPSAPLTVTFSDFQRLTDTAPAE